MNSPAFVRIAPFALWIACIALESLASAAGALGWTALAAAADSGWGYALRTALVAAVLALFWRHYGELRGGSAGEAGLRSASSAASPGASRPAPRGAQLAQALAAGALVFAAWITLGPWLLVGGPSTPRIPPGAGGAPDALWLLFRVAGSALVVPLIEELFWRSYLMRRIDTADFLSLPPARVSATAVLASSAIFALEHRELAAGLAAGLLYAWLYRRHQDLRLPVLAHATTNALLAAYVVGATRYEFW